MNLKLLLGTLSQATLSIILGMIICPDSAQASKDFKQENLKIAKPTLLLKGSQQALMLTQALPKETPAISETIPSAVTLAQENTNIGNQNKPRPISINVDSHSTIQTKSISIPVVVENNSNKDLTNFINIPVVPNVTDKLLRQNKESNPVVTLESIDSPRLIENNSLPEENTLVSQQVKSINPSLKQSKQKSVPNEELVSSVSIQIEYYDPTTSPSVESMISPNLPSINSPDPYLPHGSNSFNGYIWPAEGVFTSGYGWRWGRMHKGIDIAAPIGTPIVAAADGKVISAGWNSGGYGNLVKIKHFDGSITLYAHNSKIMVRRGQWVKQGQQIAKMGNTGFSTGPHLHFEIHSQGKKAMNPIALLPKKR